MSDTSFGGAAASDEELSSWRQKIDALDEQMLTLLSERAQMARRIAAIKQACGEGGHYHRPEREAQVMRRLLSTNQGPLPNEAIARIYREVMSACLALERPLRVGYVGGEQALVQGAVVSYFGHGAKAIMFDSVADVLRETEVGAVDYGVLPREYIQRGSVCYTVDALLDFHLHLTGEVQQGWRGGDNSQVTVRCWVVSRQPVPPSGSDSTQLLVKLNDRPGALAKLLEGMARHGINLAHIESRPVGGASQDAGCMGFFLELEGHSETPALAAALDELAAMAEVRVLGSYPREVLI